MKRIWRLPFDWVEGLGMRGVDTVVVNSGFTKGVVESVWNDLGGVRGIGVVYPCVDTKQRRDPKEQADQGKLWDGKKIILSINRFERKKDVGLAIKAFAGLGVESRRGVRLVIAGKNPTDVIVSVL